MATHQLMAVELSMPAAQQHKMAELDSQGAELSGKSQRRPSSEDMGPLIELDYSEEGTTGSEKEELDLDSLRSSLNIQAELRFSSSSALSTDLSSSSSPHALALRGLREDAGLWAEIRGLRGQEEEQQGPQEAEEQEAEELELELDPWAELPSNQSSDPWEHVAQLEESARAEGLELKLEDYFGLRPRLKLWNQSRSSRLAVKLQSSIEPEGEAELATGRGSSYTDSVRSRYNLSMGRLCVEK